MRRFPCSLAAALAAVLAGPARADTPATVALSNGAAGAHPVAVTLTIETPLICGRLAGGTVTIALPATERVPRTVAASAVTIGGRSAAGVAVSGHTLSVMVARPKGVICQSIVVGPARIVLTQAAGLGNPKSAGAYRVVVRRGGEAFAATMTVNR